MQLKYMEIIKTNGNTSNLEKIQVIRRINFKEKLNLIIDSDGTQGEGNSIGKTTFLYLIDICFGADKVTEIYADNENKQRSNLVENFINTNFIAVELKFDENIVIRPLFFSNEKKEYNTVIFNNRLIGIKEYLRELLHYFFKPDSSSPSFRELIGKFIRIKSHEMEHILRYLYASTANSVYLIVRRFLFGYSGLDSTRLKIKAEKELKDLKKQHKDIAKLNIQELEQELALLRKDAKELEIDRNKLNLADNIEKLILEQADDDYKYTELKSKIDTLKFGIERSKKSISLLEADRSKIDKAILQSMYIEAQDLVANISKQFEELVLFHNKSIENEKQFIEQRLSKLISEQEEVNRELSLLSQKRLSIKVADELNSIAKKLSETNQTIGRYEAQRNRFVTYKTRCDELSDEIKKYAVDTEEASSFNEKLKVFNSIFNDYFKIIYNEESPVIYADESEGVSIQSERERKGAGGKSGAVVVFDLAYFSFAQKETICAPKFQIHDRLELTDYDAKKRAFIDILPTIDCQFIVPALRSSLNEFSEEFINENKILELSKTDKLFRIEQIAAI